MKWNFLKKLFQFKKTVQIYETSAPDEVKLRNYATNVQTLEEVFSDSEDIKFRRFIIGEHCATLIFADSLVNKELITENILQPLMFLNQAPDGELNGKLLQKRIANRLSVPEIKDRNRFSEVIDGILSGEAALLIDGIENALSIDVKGWEGRSVNVPTNESTTYGPQEAFVENLTTNISMIRKRIRDPQLKIKYKTIGRRGKSKMAMVYVNDIVNREVLAKVEGRIDDLDIDLVVDIGIIEDLFSDNHFSIFPQFLKTERPDKIVGNLMEGQVALVLENTPYVYLMPSQFVHFVQSAEDYYDRMYVASFLRLLRLATSFITIFLPAFYIALVSYHHELIPRELIIPVAQARLRVPFPSILEALLMEGILEIIREAGARLPGPIGQTIGIVGGLVIGDAAVNANLVSAPMVIVVALTAISSFTLPNTSIGVPLRLLRFAMMFLAAMLGIYGVILGFLLALIHASSLESFDVPYFAPYAPVRFEDLKDTLIRVPHRYLRKRPSSMPHGDDIRLRAEGEIDEKD